jgi:hypothetical protein
LTDILSFLVGWPLDVMWPKYVIVVAFVVLKEVIHMAFGIVHEHATTGVKIVHSQYLCPPPNGLVTNGFMGLSNG